MDGLQGEITEMRKQIGSFDAWRTGVAERHGLFLEDDEAGVRAGEGDLDEPLASDEEVREADNEQRATGLFQTVMQRWKQRYGDAPAPDGAQVTGRGLAHIRRLQAQRLPGGAPRFLG